MGRPGVQEGRAASTLPILKTGRLLIRINLLSSDPLFQVVSAYQCYFSDRTMNSYRGQILVALSSDQGTKNETGRAGEGREGRGRKGRREGTGERDLA